VRRSQDLFDASCPDCDHPWSEHPGASFDASVDNACGECLYEDEHFGLAEVCRAHAPADLTALVGRQPFVVELNGSAHAWETVLGVVRPHASQIDLDLPQNSGWTAQEAAAATLLRSRAGLAEPLERESYTSVARLKVDDDVWAAFAMVVGRAFDAQVLAAGPSGEELLSVADEGSAVIAILTPEEFAALGHALGLDHLAPLPRRLPLAERLKCLLRPGDDTAASPALERLRRRSLPRLAPTVHEDATGMPGRWRLTGTATRQTVEVEDAGFLVVTIKPSGYVLELDDDIEQLVPFLAALDGEPVVEVVASIDGHEVGSWLGYGGEGQLHRRMTRKDRRIAGRPGYRLERRQLNAIDDQPGGAGEAQ